MAETSVLSGATRTPSGLLSRFFGIITAPKATYESVVAHSKPFGMLVLTTLLTATMVGGFLLAPVGQEAWLESATNNPLTGPVSDEQ